LCEGSSGQCSVIKKFHFSESTKKVVASSFVDIHKKSPGVLKIITKKSEKFRKKPKVNDCPYRKSKFGLILSCSMRKIGFIPPNLPSGALMLNFFNFLKKISEISDSPT